MFTWTEELATGVEKIDKQHKELFEKADSIFEIADNCEDDRVKKEVIQALDFLIDYTVDHFGYEERHMIKNNYENFVEHREEHTYFVKELYGLHKKVCEEGINDYVITSLKVMMLEWLVEHINENDKKLI